jgi:hypothetical protein
MRVFIVAPKRIGINALSCRDRIGSKTR